MAAKRYDFFETKRLWLKLCTPDDAAFIYRLVNSPDWLQYIGDRKVYSVEDAVRYIEDKMLAQHQQLGYGNYVLIRKEDGIKIGVCGLYDRPGLDSIDIGYAMLPECTGQGFAFEAANRLLYAAWYEIGIQKIQAITTMDNIASQKILDKLGLVYSGIKRLEGDEADLMLYEIESPARNSPR